MARLDRLAAVKEVAQIGAVLGREFSYGLLAAVSPLDDTVLPGTLDQLVGAGLIHREGDSPRAVYTFKHALIQDAAYQSLLRSRRQQLHAQVARVLEGQFIEVIEAAPEVLAHHYTEAGLIKQAIPWWKRAGERANTRSAYPEAIAHLNRGLELLPRLSDIPERTRQELPLRLALGVALQAVLGYTHAEVEASFGRALELCRALGETPELFPALYGLYLFHLVRAQYADALELAEACLRLAKGQGDPGLEGLALWAVAVTRFYRGELVVARERGAQGEALYDPDQHTALAASYGRDFVAICRMMDGWASSLIGEPDRARRGLREALVLARRLGHRLSLAENLTVAAVGYAYLRESHSAGELAEEAVALATEQGFPYWWAEGTVVAGWALAAQGRAEEGLARLREGIGAWRASGAEVALSSFQALLAEAYVHAGEHEAALLAVDEGLRQVEATGERCYEAELYRLRGDLRRSESAVEAERDFRHAIAVAQGQEAKALELRAATSLARLWRAQGKKEAARNLLAPVYSWFKEGFDAADLREAKALLDELV
jgi:predicted ATPase